MKQQVKVVDINEYMPVFREILEAGSPICFRITGNSMSPFLVHQRDEILLSPQNGCWKKGDMAIFQRLNGQYVMHRIYRVDKNGGCCFVGDAQQVIEGPIMPSQIFGKVTSVKRKGEWIGPGNFWWEFFEHFWIRVVPFRSYFTKAYGIIKRLSKWSG